MIIIKKPSFQGWFLVVDKEQISKHFVDDLLNFFQMDECIIQYKTIS